MLLTDLVSATSLARKTLLCNQRYVIKFFIFQIMYYIPTLLSNLKIFSLFSNYCKNNLCPELVASLVFEMFGMWGRVVFFCFFLETVEIDFKLIILLVMAKADVNLVVAVAAV